MATIIDLDAALPPDKKVKLGGRVYTLPGDIPTELFLRIQQATATVGSDKEDGVQVLYDAILDLFRTRDKTVTALPLGLAQMVTAFATIYGQQDAEDDGARPTR